MKHARNFVLVAGVIAMLAVIAGMRFASRDYFSSYLVAVLFFLSMSLGALGNAMIQRITGGAWGIALQPVFAPMIRIIPLLALAFIPVLFGLHHLYSWVDNPTLTHSTWLTPLTFTTRAITYLCIWTVLSIYYGKAEHNGRRIKHVSAIGLIVYGVTVSLASIDWIMSLMPQWYSTVFGLLIGTGQLLAGMSFAIICLPRSHQYDNHREQTQLLNDLGNMLLMYVLMWGYLAFTQYLIIWAADLPREISWYLPRLHSNWRWLMLTIVVLQFALPFLLLLSRDLKRRAASLKIIAAICLTGQWLYLFQLVIPSLYVNGFHIGWSTLLCLVAVGAVWRTALSHYLPINIQLQQVKANHG